MAHFLIAAAIAAASIPPASSPTVPDAHPAIWVVNDADTVIYLFGTFHALDGKSAWFNDEVKTAFAASDELVLETIVPEGPYRAPVRPIALPNPMPNFAVTPNASFLASTRLAITAGRARGMKADNGADMVLRRAAEASGKPVEGLETFDFQLNMFSRIPPQAAPSASSTQDVSSVGNLAIVMGQLQAAWNRGDPQIFATMLDQMRTNSPESYNVMFTQRNAKWANWIARRLDKPGTIFVAVGTGHLTGPDSIQAKLAQLGFRSSRIN
ncbi:TraB/GumN family protein [Sphingomonas sp.]|uniref:TraB/GumN family protein n=1 Tax=Sphingomonas sp. TaxID=28214 RepID=UPI00286AF78E|nr:TraB/GumN family protein [Sphingomonas sp.]